MPTFDELYEFLLTHRKPSRFEMRNGNEWGNNYSNNITQSHFDDLKLYGVSVISHHESMSNQSVKFGRDLINVNHELFEHKVSEKRLAHLF